MQRTLAKRRPTIGVLTHHCKTQGDTSLQNGLYDAALKRNVNLIIFAVDSWETLGHPLQMLLYPLASSERIEGWIIASEFPPNTMNSRQRTEFEKCFGGVPVVSINMSMEGVSKIISDDYSGMRDLLVHLIRNHGCQRIGCIRGPKDNPRAQERYRAYADVVREFGLQKENQKVVSGELSFLGGAKAVQKMDGDGRLAELQAIVTCHTEMMNGAYHELGKRGYTVPRDIALVGFDDQETSIHMVPPATRAVPNHYIQGFLAIETLLDVMHGHNALSVTSVPAKSVLGESCGCTLEHRFAYVEQDQQKQDECKACESSLLNDVAKALDLSTEKRRSFESVKRLLAALKSELWAEQETGFFLSILEDYLESERYQSITIQPWTLAIAIIHRWYIGELRDERKLKRLGVILQKAQILISSQMRYQEDVKRIEVEVAMLELRRFLARAQVCTELERLVEFMSTEITHLGIEDCIIALFDAPFRMKEGMDLSLTNDGHLSMAVQTEQVIALGERPIFPIRPMTPRVAFPKQRYVRVVQPIISRGEYFGYMVSGFGNGPSVLTDLFREEIGRTICSHIMLGRQSKPDRSKSYGLMVREANSLK